MSTVSRLHLMELPWLLGRTISSLIWPGLLGLYFNGESYPWSEICDVCYSLSSLNQMQGFFLLALEAVKESIRLFFFAWSLTWDPAGCGMLDCAIDRRCRLDTVD
jgi:hypothetical protein